MSNLADKIAAIHQPMDKTLLRVLSLILGFMHVGLVMWEPEAYSQAIGGFNALIAPALIWAICSSMVFGVGFKPRYWVWQVLFSPYISLAILLYLTVLYFS
ncbi:cyd operon protein YbgE [Vibrio mytili]|uniref:Cytochrome bd biosynthesis protein n=1 Tax=Vibrio mytili TaxID=50718 RepID=A0A0C3IB04_9VIBR|nr:cyd operon protein YbgE [Vibrio mytili]KIN11492.1 cytochrome bd biosynthesis protein [Vibrio mytili]